jgi:hypothetical protein
MARIQKNKALFAGTYVAPAPITTPSATKSPFVTD